MATISEGVETKIFNSEPIAAFLHSVLVNRNASASLKSKIRIALTEKPCKDAKHSIAYDILVEAHQFYSEFMCSSDNAVDLRMLVKTSKVFVENVPAPVRSPELQKRLENLQRQQNQRVYDKMVENVEQKKLNFGQELGGAVRSTGKQMMSIVNFVLSVAAAFAFAFVSSKYAFTEDFGLRLIFSIVIASVVALADLYFMTKVEI